MLGMSTSYAALELGCLRMASAGSWDAQSAQSAEKVSSVRQSALLYVLRYRWRLKLIIIRLLWYLALRYHIPGCVLLLKPGLL